MKLEIRLNDEDPFEDIYPVVGKFVIQASRAEYALDEFLWEMSKRENGLLHAYKPVGAQKRGWVVNPPSKYEDKIDLAVHFISNSRLIGGIEDRDGPLDVPSWGQQFKDVYNFRNDVLHGGVNLVYRHGEEAVLRYSKYPKNKSESHRTYAVSAEALEHGTEVLRFGRILLWEALAKVREQEES